jgi:hypothetical protein
MCRCRSLNQESMLHIPEVAALGRDPETGADELLAWPHKSKHGHFIMASNNRPSKNMQSTSKAG